MAEFSSVELEVEVNLGKGKYPLSVLQAVGKGSILILENDFCEPLTVYVNGIPKFKAEVITQGNKFGVKILDEY